MPGPRPRAFGGWRLAAAAAAAFVEAVGGWGSGSSVGAVADAVEAEGVLQASGGTVTAK
jgi:hypothetical protein